MEKILNYKGEIVPIQNIGLSERFLFLERLDTIQSDKTTSDIMKTKKAAPHLNCQFCEAREKSVFCELTKEDASVLSEWKECTLFGKHQIIFKENAYPHGLFCINSGKIKLYQMVENGREQIVRLAKTGDILGYRSLLSGEKYSATAEAIEESSVCFIPENHFFKLLEANIAISKGIMKILAGDLKNAEHRIVELAQKPVRERMSGTLSYLKEVYGLEKDNATINVVVRREDIANIAGTATETAIRILADLKNEGIIQFIGKKIKIAKMRA